MLLQARPYQSQLVTDASSLFRTYRSVCLVLPTGAGKTVISALISKMLAQAGDSCLYLVHRRELIRQVYDTLNDLGLGDLVGVIAPGWPETPWAPFQIASVSTLVRRFQRLTWLKPRMLFVDEAHHVRAKSWEQILDYFANAYRLLLTASPQRLDGKGLGKYADVLLEGPTIPWLAANDYLCEVETFYASIDALHKGLKKQGNDFSQSKLDERVDGPTIAAAMPHINRFCRDRRTLFYAINTRHSRELVAECNFHGIPAEHVDGNTPAAQRDATMRRFREGTTRLLANVGLFTEGLDVPECDCIVHGRPTASLVLYLQANGRCRRPKFDGRKALIVDLVGNVERHGLPDEAIEWTLDGGAEEESVKKARRNTRLCADCGYAYPSYKSSCPLCGATHTLKTVIEVEIELEEARANKKAEQKRRGELQRELNRKVFHSGGDPAKLDALRKEYGRHPNIVEHWNRIFGEAWERKRREQSGYTRRYA